MGRILLLLLVGAFIVAINPTLRAKAKPYVQPALDPLYEWQVRSRVAEIARGIEADRAAGRSLPTDRTFAGYLEDRFPGGDGALDPWGTPFYLRRTRRELVVGSAGRDRERATGDDVLSPPVPLPRER